jgi:hypothetical protein
MRNQRIRHKLLLLTILTLGLTLAPAMLAQQRSTGSAAAVEAIQDDRQPIPALDCKNYSEYIGGKADNFAAPVETPTKSPGLQQFFSSNHLTSRNYDEPGVNKAFGQSFFIKCCKVCRAELEIRVKNEGEISSNDAITIGQAPFTGVRAAAGFIWQAPFVPGAGTGTPIKTMNIPLSPAALNSYILNSNGCQVPLDIYVQDDTSLDYVKLKIWTY